MRKEKKRKLSMDDDNVYEYSEDFNNLCGVDSDIIKSFDDVPDVARPLVRGAKSTLSKVKKILYSAPAFINLVKASVPEQTLQAILTDEQKEKLASGALEIMTKKDGKMMANLINTETKKIAATISLENVDISPDLSQAMTSYALQVQMTQIAKEIQYIRSAIEEVRQGQENDRLATAYSCQQKLLQAMVIKNPELKEMALLGIVSNAEDSRNLLMQSQNINLKFIQEQPDSLFGKVLSGETSEKIKRRINEIRDSFNAINMVSLAEAIAYQEMGESEAARQSLKYYADYIEKTYLRNDGLIEKLDSVDPSPKNYWSKTLPDVKRKIDALPCADEIIFLEEEV